MTRASGARSRGFDSRCSPLFFLLFLASPRSILQVPTGIWPNGHNGRPAIQKHAMRRVFLLLPFVRHAPALDAADAPAPLGVPQAYHKAPPPHSSRRPATSRRRPPSRRPGPTGSENAAAASPEAVAGSTTAHAPTATQCAAAARASFEAAPEDPHGRERGLAAA